MLVTSFYNMADTFFVGMIGTSASAAVGVVFSLMAVIQACGFFFGHGSGNFIARALGAHDEQDAERMASTGFFSALIAGAVLAILGLIFIRPLPASWALRRRFCPMPWITWAISSSGLPA